MSSLMTVCTPSATQLRAVSFQTSRESVETNAELAARCSTVPPDVCRRDELRAGKEGEESWTFKTPEFIHFLFFLISIQEKERQSYKTGGQERTAEQAVKLCARLIRECLDSFGQESTEATPLFVKGG